MTKPAIAGIIFYPTRGRKEFLMSTFGTKMKAAVNYTGLFTAKGERLIGFLSVVFAAAVKFLFGEGWAIAALFAGIGVLMMIRHKAINLIKATLFSAVLVAMLLTESISGIALQVVCGIVGLIDLNAALTWFST